MTALKKWIMAKILMVCSLPTSNIFITTSPLPEMHCVRSNAMRPMADRFGSTVVFLLNELFVTVHVDDILNT